MYAYALDKVTVTMVGMLTRPFNEDVDNQELLDSIAKQQALSPSPGATAVFVLIVDPSYPNPNARWRRRFAEARDSVRFPKALFAFVSPTPHLRGVVTAVNWMRPPSPRFEGESFAGFEEAARWIEEKQGKKRPVLQQLFDEVQAKAGSTTPGGGARVRPIS
jgi:hypothetical protein